ncbi:MAG: hypothetical protein LBD52_08600 [Prevotellaceae bacterium]|nr:hypothetical protein [Prevotellaceae bacterium]
MKVEVKELLLLIADNLIEFGRRAFNKNFLRKITMVIAYITVAVAIFSIAVCIYAYFDARANPTNAA